MQERAWSSIRKRFCLNTATIKNIPVQRQIQLAAAAGFCQIGLWLEDIDAAVREGNSLHDISGWLDQGGLKLVELCFLGGWQEAKEADFPRVLARTHHICQISRGLGCDIVVVVPALSRGSFDGAPARFRAVCEAAAEHEVRIALEFPFTAAEVRDLATSWRIVSAADCENGGLTLDWFHFSLGGSLITDLAGSCGEKVFLVHLSDAMDVPPEQLRVHHDYRTFPGEGTLRYEPLFRALRKLNYQGAFSLEIWNKNLSTADPAQIVQKGFESMLSLEQIACPQSTHRRDEAAHSREAAGYPKIGPDPGGEEQSQ